MNGVSNRKGISVVIPNYNGEGLLPVILPALYSALDHSGLLYEVIVSDDASTDASVAFIREQYPQIKLIENKANRGFSPAINRGIFKAQYELVLLLNSDVKLERDYFKHQLSYFNDPDCFGVMGRIVGWEDDQIQDASKFPSFHGVKIKTTGNYLPLNYQEGEKLFSMYLSGANALVNREKLLALNGFDEIYAPFYVEDFDLSLRAWRVGWHCYYEHRSICRHRTSTTIKNKSKKSQINRIYYRNKLFLHAIHLPSSKQWLWMLQLILETLIRLFTGRFYFLGSILDFFRNQSRTKKSRSALSALGKITGRFLSLSEVVEKIKASIGNTPIQRF